MKKINNWIDKKFNELTANANEMSKTELFLKSAGLGAMEGALDGLPVVLGIVVTTGIIKIVTKNK